MGTKFTAEPGRPPVILYSHPHARLRCDGALVACLVLLPAFVRLWTGRSLSRSLDDSAIGERLIAMQRVHTFALALAVSLLLLVWPPWWAFPVTWLAYVAAAYPLRLALYEEMWSFPRYVLFCSRPMLSFAGFWIVLGTAPLVVGRAHRFDWVAAMLLGVLLIAWNTWHSNVLRFIMRTRPLADPILRKRFEDLAASCSIPMPRFEQIDRRGGVIANAGALASRHGSSVVFTDTAGAARPGRIYGNLPARTRAPRSTSRRSAFATCGS